MLKKHKCHERLENIFPSTTHGKYSWSQNQHRLHISSTPLHNYRGHQSDDSTQQCSLRLCDAAAHINYLNMQNFNKIDDK